jgi:hypothetical protein
VLKKKEEKKKMLFLSRAHLAAQLKKPLHSMWQPC